MYLERRYKYINRHMRKRKAMKKARNKRIITRWKKRMERKIYES